MSQKLTLGVWEFGYGLFRRHLACRFGHHASPILPKGSSPSNFCSWCGHAYVPDARKSWVVTLKTGEVYEVQAVNPFHAGSQVVFGAGTGAFEVVKKNDGFLAARVVGATNVHRENIASVILRQ